MLDKLPGTQRLLIAWFTLMGLTLLSMWSAQLGATSPAPSLPLWAIALVLLAAGYKVQQILLVYLNLRVSSSGWRGSFLALLWFTLTVVALAYVIPL